MIDETWSGGGLSRVDGRRVGQLVTASLMFLYYSDLYHLRKGFAMDPNLFAVSSQNLLSDTLSPVPFEEFTRGKDFRRAHTSIAPSVATAPRVELVVAVSGVRSLSFINVIVFPVCIEESVRELR